jgi:ribosomal-protein-alanine N-acetyltransferase
VLYRPYTPEDFAALYAVEEVCFEPPFRFGRGTMRSLAASPQAATWIAEEDGRLAGFGIVEWPPDGGEHAAYIQTIEVAPDQRRLGVGGKLLERLEQSAESAGAQVIWLHVDAENAGAIRLYEARGYTRRGREPDYYPRGRAALVYAKALQARAQKPVAEDVG